MGLAMRLGGYRKMKAIVEHIVFVLMLINPVFGTLGLIMFIVVGPWDFLVWLTNADWITTHFKIPLLGLVCGVVAIMLDARILMPALLWAEASNS